VRKYSICLCSIELVHFVDNITCFKLFHATGLVEVGHGLGTSVHQTKTVTLTLLVLSLTQRSSKEVFVFLVGEVDIVVSVGMRELGWVIPVILPSGARMQTLAVVPSLKMEVAHRATTVVITDFHSPLVGLVVDRLCT